MLTSLAELLNHFKNKANTTGIASLYAIVLESTFPLFRPQTNDYITQISIKDTTLIDSKVTFKVYLICPKSFDIMITDVGQIVFLSQFEFQIRGDYYIEGRPTFESIIKRSFFVSSLTYQQNQKFQNTKNWFLLNFQKIYKPDIGLGKYILNQKVLVCNSFNMILKVKEKVASGLNINNTISYIYKLVDDYDNQFSIQFPTAFGANDYVFIKNISHVQNNLYIILQSISNVMRLPKAMKYSYRTISSKNEEYIYPRGLTCIKCSLSLHEDSITSLKELNYKVQQFEKGNKMIKQDHSSFFTKDRQVFLQEHVIKVYPVTVSGSIRLFNGTFFVDEEEIDRDKIGLSNFSSKWNKKLWYVYNMVFWVKDQSIQETDQLFPIHLFDFDGNGSDFFPKINLKQLNIFLQKKIQSKYMVIQIQQKSHDDDEKVSYGVNNEAIQIVLKQKRKVEQKINEFVQKLYSKTNPLQLVTFVVEPLIDKFQMRYRISHTRLNEDPIQ